MKKLRLWTTATISCAHLLRLRGLRTPSACPTPLGTWDDVGCVPPQCNSEFSHCVRFWNKKERAKFYLNKHTVHWSFCTSQSMFLVVATFHYISGRLAICFTLLCWIQILFWQKTKGRWNYRVGKIDFDWHDCLLCQCECSWRLHTHSGPCKLSIPSRLPRKPRQETRSCHFMNCWYFQMEVMWMTSPLPHRYGSFQCQRS